MELDIKKDGTKAEVFFSGNMYVEDSPSVREKLTDLLDDGILFLVLNLSGLEYVDSSGLGVLISIHKRCLEKGGKMVVSGLRGMVDDLFKLTRLDLVFNIERE